MKTSASGKRFEHPKAIATVAEDRKSVALDFLHGSGAEGSMTLSKKELERFMRFLGEARAYLTDPHDPKPLEKEVLRATVNPRWYTDVSESRDSSVLTFDHQEMGPIRFVIPKAELEKMMLLLSKQLDVMEGVVPLSPDTGAK